MQCFMRWEAFCACNSDDRETLTAQVLSGISICNDRWVVLSIKMLMMIDNEGSAIIQLPLSHTGPIHPHARAHTRTHELARRHKVKATATTKHYVHRAVYRHVFSIN